MLKNNGKTCGSPPTTSMQIRYFLAMIITKFSTIIRTVDTICTQNRTFILRCKSNTDPGFCPDVVHHATSNVSQNCRRMVAQVGHKAKLFPRNLGTNKKVAGCGAVDSRLATNTLSCPLSHRLCGAQKLLHQMSSFFVKKNAAISGAGGSARDGSTCPRFPHDLGTLQRG